jgi:hypothetical protein
MVHFDTTPKVVTPPKYDKAVLIKRIAEEEAKPEPKARKPKFDPEFLLLAEMFADKYASCKKRWADPGNDETDNKLYKKFKALLEAIK